MPQDSKYHLHISTKTRVLNFFRKILISTGLDKLLAKLVRHKSPDSLIAKLTPPNYLYKTGTVRNFTIKGINYSLDLSDTVGHSNYFAISDPGHNILYSLVKPGMTIVDIGANVGSTTLNFARLAGEKGSVYSFEPDKLNHSRAVKNISLNKYSNIKLFNVGLGSTRETAYQYNVNENNRGMLRILADAPGVQNLEKSAIEVETLDHMVDRENFAMPDLLKIDVEGYELKVLRGGEGTLEKYKPILFIELDDENLREQGSSAAELVGFLTERGYGVIDAASKKPLTKDSDFKNCHIDIVARAR